jgi:hypothetical protein
VLCHFLLVFDPRAQTIIKDAVYTDPKAAADAYSEAEREYGYRDAVEIVLIGADSIETIKKTHGHYFGAGVDEPYLAGI